MSRETSISSPYRKVSVGTWAELKVRNLTPINASGRALFMMLMCGPQTTNVPGVQPVGRMAFAEMLDWDLKGFDEAFAEVFSEGLAEADWKARFVFVPSAIKDNLPQSPNVVKSWRGTWAKVPECALKVLAWNTLHDALLELGSAFVDAFKAACPLASESIDKHTDKPTPKPSDNPSAKPFDKTIDNQEQEQEQEQEQKKSVRTEAVASVLIPAETAPPKPEKLPNQLGVNDLVTLGVDKQHATDWLKIRKGKRAPLTQTALDVAIRESAKANITLAEAVKVAVEENWAGFKAAWYANLSATAKTKTPPADNFAGKDYGRGGKL